MKTDKNKKIITLLGILIMGLFIIDFYGYSRRNSAAQYVPPPSQYLIDYQNFIIGTFIGETDTYWKLTFTSNGKCYWYREGILLSINTYAILNSSPQCGMDVSVDENTETGYLSLVDDADGLTQCYSINGITNTILSLRPLGEGGLIVLNKQ